MNKELKTRHPNHRKTKKQRSRRLANRRHEHPEHPDRIIIRLLRERLLITENGVSRQGTVLKGILLKLWVATLPGKPRAFTLWNQYGKLLPTTHANRVEIDFDDGGEPLELDPDHPQERLRHEQR